MAAKLYTDATKAMKALKMIEARGSSAKISIETVCKKNILTYGDLRKIVEVDKNTMPLIDTGARSVYKAKDPNLIDDLNTKVDNLNNDYADSDPIQLRKGVLIKVTAKVIKDLVKVMKAHSGSSDAINTILDSIGEKEDKAPKIAEAKAQVKELKKIAKDATKAYEKAQKAYEKAVEKLSKIEIDAPLQNQNQNQKSPQFIASNKGFISAYTDLLNSSELLSTTHPLRKHITAINRIPLSATDNNIDAIYELADTVYSSIKSEVLNYELMKVYFINRITYPLTSANSFFDKDHTRNERMKTCMNDLIHYHENGIEKVLTPNNNKNLLLCYHYIRMYFEYINKEPINNRFMQLVTYAKTLGKGALFEIEHHPVGFKIWDADEVGHAHLQAHGSKVYNICKDFILSGRAEIPRDYNVPIDFTKIINKLLR